MIAHRSNHVFIVWTVSTIFIVNTFPGMEYTFTYEERMCVWFTAFIMAITALSHLGLAASSLCNDVFLGLHWSVGVILLIATLTNGLIAWVPTPVKLNPFTGSPVYLVRQLEWIAIAYLIAYVIAMLDPDVHKSEPALIREVTDSVKNALSTKQDPVSWEGSAHQSGLETAAVASSALFGLLTSSPVVYAAIIITSCFIFTRLVTRFFGHWSHYKTINFDLIHNLEKAHELSAEHIYCQVLQMRINIAANWAALCAVGWSLLVLNYFMCWGCIAESEGASVYIECIVETVTKTGLAVSVLIARESDLRLQLLVQKLTDRLERDKEILDLKARSLRMEVERQTALRKQEFKGICPTLIFFGICTFTAEDSLGNHTNPIPFVAFLVIQHSAKRVHYDNVLWIDHVFDKLLHLVDGNVRNDLKIILTEMRSGLG
jgi:hypothetical protein